MAGGASGYFSRSVHFSIAIMYEMAQATISRVHVSQLWHEGFGAGGAPCHEGSEPRSTARALLQLYRFKERRYLATSS